MASHRRRSVSTTLTSRSHLEASSHLRGRDERQHPRRARRAPRKADRRVHRAVHPYCPVRAPHGRPRSEGLAVHQRKLREPHGRPGLEVRRRAGTDRAAEHRQRALGAVGPRGRCPARRRRRRPLPVSLDARVRAGGPAAFVERDFIQWRPPTGDETTLGVVDFSICPHLAADGMPGNSIAEAEQWAAGIPNAAYAMDDQTAITVVDGELQFVSEGHWKQLRTLSSEPDQA